MTRTHTSQAHLTLVSSRQPTLEQIQEAAAQTLVCRLQQHCGLDLPLDMARDFQARHTPWLEGSDAWLTDAQVLAQWLDVYQPEAGLQLLALGDHALANGHHHMTLSLRLDTGGDTGIDCAQAYRLEGQGDSTAQACAHALINGMDWEWDITQVHHQVLGEGPEAEHVVLVASQWEGHLNDRWGAGLHTDPQMAVAMAVLHSALAWPQAHSLGDLDAMLPEFVSMTATGDGQVTPSALTAGHGAHCARIIAWPGRQQRVR